MESCDNVYLLLVVTPLERRIGKAQQVFSRGVVEAIWNGILNLFYLFMQLHT